MATIDKIKIIDAVRERVRQRYGPEMVINIAGLVEWAINEFNLCEIPHSDDCDCDGCVFALGLVYETLWGMRTIYQNARN